MMRLTVRECPAELHAKLDQAAQAARRSKSREAVAWLEAQARQSPGDRVPEAVLLARIASRNWTMKLSARHTRRAREEGRA